MEHCYVCLVQERAKQDSRGRRLAHCTLPRGRKDLRHADVDLVRAVDGALYARAYNDTKSRWYQAAMRQKAGRVIAAGMTKDVSFEAVNGPLNERIDEAYRAKYRASPYLNPMIGPDARATTVKVIPPATRRVT